jgi:hypothetical protein
MTMGPFVGLLSSGFPGLTRLGVTEYAAGAFPLPGTRVRRRPNW